MHINTERCWMFCAFVDLVQHSRMRFFLLPNRLNFNIVCVAPSPLYVVVAAVAINIIQYHTKSNVKPTIKIAPNYTPEISNGKHTKMLITDQYAKPRHDFMHTSMHHFYEIFRFHSLAPSFVRLSTITTSITNNPSSYLNNHSDLPNQYVDYLSCTQIKSNRKIKIVGSGKFCF